jgi:hypothetical protein
MGELEAARGHIVEHLHSLAPAAAVEAHLLLATIALNLGTPNFDLIKDIWDHYYQTNIAPFKWAQIPVPART